MLLIDIQSLQTGSKYRGIGRYVRGLIRSLISQLGGNNIHVIMNDSDTDSVIEFIDDFPSIPLKNVHFFYAFKDTKRGQQDFAKNRRISEKLYCALINQLNPSYFLVPSLFEIDSFYVSIKGLSESIRTGCVIHDFIPYENQDIYLSNLTLKSEYLYKFEQLRLFNDIFAVSEYSANQTKKHVPECPNVINTSSASDLNPDNFAQNRALSTYLSKYKDSEFIFYFGGIDDRKNVPFLIDSFKEYKRRHPGNLKLLILGQSRNARASAIQNKICKEHLEKSVSFELDVADDDLIQLLTIAKLTVFPSLDEGFGLPVLEAMNFDAPVICSNTTSMPEVIGWDKATFSPTDINDCVNTLEYFLTSEIHYQELKTHIASQRNNFSWSKTASRILQEVRKSDKNSEGYANFDLHVLIKDIVKNFDLTSLDSAFLAQSVERNFYEQNYLLNNPRLLTYIFSTEKRGQRNCILLMDNISNPDAELVDNFTLFKNYKGKYEAYYIASKKSSLLPQLQKEQKRIVLTETSSLSVELIELLSRTCIILDSFQQISKLKISSLLSDSPIKTIYTQHGITYFKPGFLGCDEISEKRYDYIVFSSPVERNVFNQYYNYADNQIIESGLARWDLIQSEKSNTIFFYFTGRQYINFLSPNEIQKTDYVQNIKAIFNNKEFEGFCKEHKINVFLALHHTISFVNIDLPEWVTRVEEKQISSIKNSAEVLVTDFSSMCFDFLTKEKAVFYFLPDDDSPYLKLSADSYSNHLELKAKIAKIGKLSTNINDLVAGLKNLKQGITPQAKFEFYVSHNICKDLEKKIDSLPREVTPKATPPGEWFLKDDVPFKFSGLSIRTLTGRSSDSRSVNFYLTLCRVANIEINFNVLHWEVWSDNVPSIQVYLDDVYLYSFKAKNACNQKISIKIDRTYTNTNHKITLRFERTICPERLYLNQDNRERCIDIKSIKII
jgi:glycosyltransferase involved in cell wall biosynthesis/CDP-glycerol glycerophosphotransferase (TagB/SpsB family)